MIYSGCRERGSRSFDVAVLGRVTNGPPSNGAADVKATSGMSLGYTFERKFFPQREERIAFPHQNSPQIGMAFETKAHHVVNLALVPVRRRPDIGNGVDCCRIFRNAKFQPQMNRQRHRVKLVDNFKARIFAEIIDARDVDEIIEGEIVATELRHFAQIVRGDREGQFAAKFRSSPESLRRIISRAKRAVPAPVMA